MKIWTLEQLRNKDYLWKLMHSLLNFKGSTAEYQYYNQEIAAKQEEKENLKDLVEKLKIEIKHVKGGLYNTRHNEVRIYFI
jgi:hypothetical protein